MINIKEKVSIREYKSLDKKLIIDIFRLNTPKYFSPEEENDLERYLDNEIEYYCLAEINGKIIGSGGINSSDNKAIGIISWDIIHPDFQGKGIGTLLLIHRMEKLKNLKEINQILVRTSQHSYNFYEKQGFKLVEITEDYWAKGFHLYNMKFNL